MKPRCSRMLRMSVDADSGMMEVNWKSGEQHVRGTTCPVTTNKVRRAFCQSTRPVVASWLAVPRNLISFLLESYTLTYSGLVIHAEAGPDLTLHRALGAGCEFGCMMDFWLFCQMEMLKRTERLPHYRIELWISRLPQNCRKPSGPPMRLGLARIAKPP